VIELRDPPPEPEPNRRALISRRFEHAFIALALAVLVTIIILMMIGVIPLWIILGTH
jgi:hypothetical protein